MLTCLPLALGMGGINLYARISLIAFILGAYSCIAWFITKWDGSRGPTRMSLHAALLTVFVGISLTWGFSAFFGSLLTVLPTVTFNFVKFFMISALQILIAPVIALVQIAILLLCIRFAVRDKYQPFWMLLPIVVVGIIISTIAVTQSMPAARFKSVIGVPPHT